MAATCLAALYSKYLILAMLFVVIVVVWRLPTLLLLWDVLLFPFIVDTGA